MLSKADGRYLERKLRFLRDKVSAPLISELETRLLAGQISSELDRVSQFAAGRPGPRVRVFRPAAEASGEELLATFAKMAAPYVMQLIGGSSRCGVTWGRMLAKLVAAAKRLGTRQKAATEFVPLAGEPLGFAPTSSSSSILSDEFQQLVLGSGHHARSLTMLPALIPRDFNLQERITIKKLIGRLRDYQEIFLGAKPGDPPIAESLDALITSVGRHPLGFKDGSLLDKDEERPLFLGDIGGVLLPKRAEGPGQDRKLAEAMADLADRWTGLRVRHVRACADLALAAPSAAVGVVVLSVGGDRAPVVFECVKLGLISHLLIDGALEQALLDVCRVRSRI
jgi:hypothetical protein